MATCTMEKHSEEKVVQKLNELFGNVLNLDIIKGVAVSCHYDVIESSNKLLQITSFPYGESVIQLKEKGGVPRNVPLPKTTNINSQVSSVSTSLSNTHFAPMSKKAQDVERAINYIQKGYKVLIIMRGVPGSGKSYLAKELLKSTIGFDNSYKYHILSTDDFFAQNGVYQYNPLQLSEAHGWNHNRAFQALSRGFSPVIIDNTNTQIWEMKPYAMMATDHGYIIEIIEPDTHWCFNEKELTKRNSHGVPRATIKEMIDRYQKNLTPQKLLSAYNLSYKLQMPPQMRLYPPLRINNSFSANSLSTNVSVQRSSEGNNIIKSKSISALNVRPFVSKNVPVETINLMDFNDDKANSMQTQPTLRIRNNEISVTSWDQNPVDKILMCSNDSTNGNSNILLPSTQNADDVITIESSDDENSSPQAEKKLFPDIETAWGVNETALRSWDIVTPIKDEGNFTKLPRYSTNECKIQTKDSSCNTDEAYFQLLRNKQTTNNNSLVKILDTLNRDINRFTPERKPTVTKKYMLDKSCLTDDIFDDYDNHISQLINLFPSVPTKHLKYWYKKCKGDLEWTIEFLLEAKEEISVLTETFSDDSDVHATEVNGSESDNSDCNQEAEIVNSKDLKIKRSRKTSDEHKDLKKLIESKVEINDEHYSKHLLKVKHFKFGSSGFTDNPQPSTSTVNDEPLDDTSKISQSVSSESPIYQGTHMADAEKVAMVESDMEFDDFEWVDNAKPEIKPEDTIELNLGDNFVSQLEDTFGDPNMTYPKGFLPVVQVPITLARQLYTFYIESVYQQMETQKQVLDTLISEDEEFARKLQAKEEELQEQSQPPTSFRQIMDEQAAQCLYQKEIDKWKNLNPDNLAARLTREKLFKVFPSVEKDTLIEILYAHNNKYQDTVETLLASTRPDDVRGSPNMIKEPPLRDDILHEMKEAHKNNTKEEYTEQHVATFYRDEANKHLKKRADLYQRAQQYHQRGMTEVAQFYSGLASQQTEYFEIANNMAATAFLDEHSKRLQDFNTIDLHFLYVKEALSALDLFLDRNINLLRLSDSKRVEYLQIITGRGKRSENGLSKIRPAAIGRLKKRKIQFVQLNPGLLKVKITKNSLATSEM